MVLERGTLLNNRYRIVEILGQGGMGSVYRAVDENLGVEVAVKDNLFTTEDYARQFRREAIILANLRHTNLPRVTDHFVIEGQSQYLVMDYIEGEDLRQRMDRSGVLPEEEVITIGAAVCDALTYLASRKPSIIHRDIKPGNVKVTPQGHIFLVDFGLAKTMQGSQATTTGARAMTPGFSPPEQYGTARTDNRTDIFSLGATLYAALTGAMPEDALARAMDQTGLTAIRKHNPRVSRRLSSVIEKALEVRPDDRYQTAEEFKQALLSASSASRRRNGDYVVAPPPEEERPIPPDSASLPPEAGEKMPRASAVQYPQSSSMFPVSTPLEDLETELRKRPRKRRQGIGCWAALLLAIVLVVGAGGVAYALDPGLPGRLIFAFSPVVPAPTSVLTAVSDSATPTLAAETQVQPTVTAEIISTETPSPIPTETLSPTPTPTETPLPSETPTPALTPMGGGGMIAYASMVDEVAQIFVINSDGSGKRQVTESPGGACQPAWSPDGLRLVFVSPCSVDKGSYPSAALFIVNLDGSGVIPLPAISGGDFDPAWSPDGKKIAFTSLRSGRSQIYLYNLDDGSTTVLSEKYSSDMQPAWSLDGSKIVFISNRQGGPSQVWMMDADGKNHKRYSRADHIFYHPRWSPDGRLILVTRSVAEGGVPQLVALPLESDGYDIYNVSLNTMPMREAMFAPDGFWIVFDGWVPAQPHHIYIMASNGAGIIQVTDGPQNDFDLAWQPLPK